MRPVMLFVGIGMVILGPLVTLSAFSSCLGTILSGNVFACVTNIVYFVLGGIIFVAGVITAIIGVFVPDPAPTPSPASHMVSVAAQSGVQVICSKCGHAFGSGFFFCPPRGQSPG